LAEASGSHDRQHATRKRVSARAHRVSSRAADYRALLRRRVRCAAPPLPARRHPFLPWALFPSKVQRASLRSGRTWPARDRQCGAETQHCRTPVPTWRPRRTAIPRRTTEIPLQIPTRRPAEAEPRDTTGWPKPSPAPSPFQRGARPPIVHLDAYPDQSQFIVGAVPAESFRNPKSRSLKPEMPSTFQPTPESDCLSTDGPAGQLHRPSWGF